MLSVTQISRVLLLFLGMYFVGTAWSQQSIVQNKSFDFGESLTYKIQYNWTAVWVSAGEVEFRVDSSSIHNRTCYKFSGLGKTYKRYDWFYKVRDRYESYSDLKDP